MSDSAGVAGSAGPTRLGPYQLVQPLGEGGMGVVHLAHDAQGRAVAVKVLRPALSADADARRRLAREVDSLRRVRHPRVADVLDADLEGERPYLVTRFVPGRPLDAHVREFGPMSEGQIVHAGRVLGEALRAIHAAGVVHRDVKPANVMVLDGEPVLIDFGIAHLAEGSRLTSTGLVMGTPGYLSPEVAGGAEVTAATDWWGWGATLVFAATGRPPFGTGPIEVVLDRVRRGQADLDGAPGRVRPVLAAALAVDPAVRPPAEALLAGLDGAPMPAASSPLAATQVVRVAPTLMLPDAGPPDVRRASQPPVRRPPGPPPSHRPAAPSAGPAFVPPADAVLTRSPWPARWTLLLTAAGFALMGVVAPPASLVLLTLASTVARTVDRSSTALLRRRATRGVRRSDGAVTAAALPWRGALALVASVLALILPVLVGTSAAFVAGFADGRPYAAPNPEAKHALLVGMLVGLAMLWRGPGGGSLRRGSRQVARGLTRGRTMRWATVGFLTLVVVGALLTAEASTQPDWGELGS